MVRPLGATEIAQENWQRRELLRNCHCAHDSSEEPNPEEPISDRLCVLITVLGAPLLAQNSGLANAVDTTVNLFRVHYAGADSHVHEFYVAGNGWHDFDLTMAARRPTVAAGSPLANAVDTTVDLFRVHYVEPTPTCTSSMWTMADGRTSILRRRRAAPQSRPALSLANAMDTTADLFRVHYVGVDSHVHEFYVNGEGWHEFDITMAAGGPAVAAGSALANAMDTTQNLFRVNYVGADSHVMNSMSMAMDGTTLI